LRIAVLSDDTIILRKEANGLIAHGTPWGQFSGVPQQARVGAFFVLEQAQRFQLTPLGYIDALEQLANAGLRPDPALPEHLRVQAFEFLHSVWREAATYLMRFPKDYVDWNAIDAAMATR